MNLKKGTLTKCPEQSGHSDPSEAEQIGPDTVSTSAHKVSKHLTQQGAESAKRVFRRLMALLALPCMRVLGNHIQSALRGPGVHGVLALIN